MFDSAKTGCIESEKVRTILNTMGQPYDERELDSFLAEQDKDGKKEVSECLQNSFQF